MSTIFKRFYVEADENFNITGCSEDFLRYLGKETAGNLDKLIPGHDFENLKNMVFAIDPGESSLICFRIKIGSGELSWIAATVKKPKDDDDKFRMDMNDIQSLKAGGVESCYDEMTGLYTKNAITEYAQMLMHLTPVKPFYFFLMDIDHFKSVNDTYGHMNGDKVITNIAAIAKECVGDSGMVGRIGGDEFMLVLENVSTEPELREILRSIRYAVREKYMDEQENKTITVSMGGALFPDYAKDYDSMFMLADKMLYLAKAKGRDRYIIYTPCIHGKVNYDGKSLTISQQIFMDAPKSDLIMELMDEFLLKKSLSFREALEKMLTVYNLDEAYILGPSDSISKFGIKAIEDGSERVYDDAALDLSSVSPEDFHPMFNTYPIKVVNLFDLKKEGYNRFSEFMVRHNYRIMIVYHMTLDPYAGYILFVSNVGSSCRFAETDFADLTYFSWMVELNKHSH